MITTYKFLLIELLLDGCKPCWNCYEFSGGNEARNAMRDKILWWSEYDSIEEMEDLNVDFAFNGDNAYCFDKDGTRIDYKIFTIANNTNEE